jgi:flagellar motor component MotA
MPQLNTRFTKEDKDACLAVVDKMVAYAEFVKENGALGLEDLMPDEESTFLKATMPLVYHGVDWEDTELILSALVFSDDKGGAGLLGKLVMAQGIVALQDGTPPKVLRLMLTAMLGEGYLPQPSPPA